MIDTNSGGPPADDRQPGRRRGWLVLALVLVLGGAFAVQATSTWKLGERQHLADFALPALILVLEVGSVTGAAIYVLTRSGATRKRAGLLVALATGVGATGGVQAYGFLIGVPIAAILLLLVDLIGRFWHEDARAGGAGYSTTNAGDEAGELEQADAPGDVVEESAAAVEEVTPSTADGACTTPEPLPVVGNIAPEVVTRAFAILDADPTTGRPALGKALAVGDSPAKRLQTAWKRHRSQLRSVGAAS